jgi:hypothetical protein
MKTQPDTHATYEDAILETLALPEAVSNFLNYWEQISNFGYSNGTDRTFGKIYS